MKWLIPLICIVAFPGCTTAPLGSHNNPILSVTTVTPTEHTRTTSGYVTVDDLLFHVERRDGKGHASTMLFGPYPSSHTTSATKPSEARIDFDDSDPSLKESAAFEIIYGYSYVISRGRWPIGHTNWISAGTFSSGSTAGGAVVPDPCPADTEYQVLFYADSAVERVFYIGPENTACSITALNTFDPANSVQLHVGQYTEVSVKQVPGGSPQVGALLNPPPTISSSTDPGILAFLRNARDEAKKKGLPWYFPIP